MKGIQLLKTVSDFMFKGKHFASTMKKVILENSEWGGTIFYLEHFYKNYSTHSVKNQKEP